MQIVEKPYLECVPQLGQVVLPGWRERFLMAVSALVGMVKFCFVGLLVGCMVEVGLVLELGRCLVLHGRGQVV